MLVYMLSILTLLNFSGKESVKLNDNVKVEIFLAGKLMVVPIPGEELRVSYMVPDSLSKFFSIKKEDNLVRISFSDSFKIKTLKQLKHLKDTVEFFIELPQDVIMNLEIGGGALKSDIELGGLRLKKLILEYGAGKVHVKFSEPNRIVMDYLEVSVGASKIEFSMLGNANFVKGEINCGAASLNIDLGGKWKEEAVLYINSGLASITLQAPKDLAFNVIKEGIVNPGLGEVRTKNPKFTIYFEGAFNAFNYEVYEK